MTTDTKTEKTALDRINKTPASRVNWFKVLCYGSIIVAIIATIWALM